MKIAYFQVCYCVLNIQCDSIWKNKNTFIWNRAVHVSTKRTSARLHVVHMRVWQTLHNKWLYLYHIQRIQHLAPGDMGGELEFCCWFDMHPHLHCCILFTDKGQFTHGINNTIIPVCELIRIYEEQ
jgi:hypothetical protein